jgi:putative ABC transport system permease protein
MKTLREIGASIRISLGGIPQRWLATLSAVLSIALVVVVLLTFLAMAAGFRQTIAGRGADDVALFLRAGSQSELASGFASDQVRLIEQLPGVARLADGSAVVSPEVYVVVDGIKRSTGMRTNLPLRGVGPLAGETRQGLKIIAGRMFRPGTPELIVGRALGGEFSGLGLGDQVRLGGVNWRVVGQFALDNPIFESEIWADSTLVQSLFDRDNIFQSARAKLQSPAAFGALAALNERDPRLKMKVETERNFYAAQASGTTDLVQQLGWPLAITMAIGALAGALNTMYSAVDARRREIGTMRCIGFSGTSAMIGTMVESVLVALVGGLLGLAAAWIFFDGLTTSTLGSGFTQVVFSFALTPAVAMNGIVIALIIGIGGGLFPAIRAARIPIREALNG